jgi:hypothetical protein
MLWDSHMFYPLQNSIRNKNLILTFWKSAEKVSLQCRYAKMSELDKYLQYLGAIRPLIFGEKHNASSFVKFIYPMVTK